MIQPVGRWNGAWVWVLGFQCRLIITITISMRCNSFADKQGLLV